MWGSARSRVRYNLQCRANLKHVLDALVPSTAPRSAKRLIGRDIRHSVDKSWTSNWRELRYRVIGELDAA
jgi:hypothetical protein